MYLTLKPAKMAETNELTTLLTQPNIKQEQQHKACSFTRQVTSSVMMSLEAAEPGSLAHLLLLVVQSCCYIDVN